MTLPKIPIESWLAQNPCFLLGIHPIQGVRLQILRIFKQIAVVSLKIVIEPVQRHIVIVLPQQLTPFLRCEHGNVIRNGEAIHIGQLDTIAHHPRRHTAVIHSHHTDVVIRPRIVKNGLGQRLKGSPIALGTAHRIAGEILIHQSHWTCSHQKSSQNQPGSHSLHRSAILQQHHQSHQHHGPARLKQHSIIPVKALQPIGLIFGELEQIHGADSHGEANHLDGHHTGDQWDCAPGDIPLFRTGSGNPPNGCHQQHHHRQRRQEQPEVGAQGDDLGSGRHKVPEK